MMQSASISTPVKQLVADQFNAEVEIRVIESFQHSSRAILMTKSKSKQFFGKRRLSRGLQIKITGGVSAAGVVFHHRAADQNRRRYPAGLHPREGSPEQFERV